MLVSEYDAIKLYMGKLKKDIISQSGRLGGMFLMLDIHGKVGY